MGYEKSKCKLIWATPNAESVMAYCARVSSKNQDNPSYENLLKYCINHNHWSIFEMASMCVEINTTRAISAQILRHRSFSFQEFSQRYSESTEFEYQKARRQDVKNRQNSIDDMSENDIEWFYNKQKSINEESLLSYREAIKKGIAKEQARFLLPLSTKTKVYMAGTVRSWMHYLKLRIDNGTQKEHSDIALEILNDIFKYQFPTIYKILITN
jgi:thymidylate synthase (FAD)